MEPPVGLSGQIGSALGLVWFVAMNALFVYGIVDSFSA